jgi:hypothetical protein
VDAALALSLCETLLAWSPILCFKSAAKSAHPFGANSVLHSNPPVIYLPRRHGFLHGAFTALLVLWAIAYPGLLILLAAFGPIGILIGVGAAILLLVPWLLGLVVLGFLRWFT